MKTNALLELCDELTTVDRELIKKIDSEDGLPLKKLL